jgi:hypothetical protein
MKRAIVLVLILVIVTFTAPAAIASSDTQYNVVEESEMSAWCKLICGISDFLCRFSGCSGGGGTPGGGSSGTGGPWDPSKTCSEQVSGSGDASFEQCENCCAVTHPSSLGETDNHACVGACIADHG